MLGRDSDRPARNWFFGTGVYALVAIIFVFGNGLPGLLHSQLITFLSLGSVLLMLEALRLEVSDTSTPFLLYAFALIAEQVLLSFLYFLDQFALLQALHLLIISGFELVLIHLANRIRCIYRSRALWLVIGVFGMFIISNISRAFMFFLIGSFPTLMDSNFFATSALILNQVSIVFYCYGYWGFVIEKTRSRLVLATQVTNQVKERERVAIQEKQLIRNTLDQRTQLMDRMIRIGRLVQSAALTGSIAHEINQPLSANRLNISEAIRLTKEISAPVGLTKLLYRIESDNGRISEIVKRIRSIFGQDRSWEQMDLLDKIVRSALEMFEEQFAKAKIGIHISLGADRPFLFVPGEIEHIIFNLLSNAFDSLEYNPGSKKEIRIETWIDKTNAYLAVRDSGPGVPSYLRDEIFELHETSKRNGMGLGLWLSRFIAERNGGTLTLADSTDEGACFVMQLPLKTLDREVS